MDSETIGMIQQYLDTYIKDKIISRNIEMWMKVKENGSIDSEKSAIIGQLYGGALRLYSNTQGYEEKTIHPDDLHQFNDLFISRLDGLEQKVETVLNKNGKK